LTKSGSIISADLETNGGLKLVGVGNAAKLAVKVDDAGGIVQLSASGEVVVKQYMNAGIPGSAGEDDTLTGSGGNVNTTKFVDADFTAANGGSGTSISGTGDVVQVFLNGILLSGMSIDAGTGVSQSDADALGSGIDYILITPDYSSDPAGTAADTVLHFLRTDIDSSDSITIIGFE
jgi:hypothetical protein